MSTENAEPKAPVDRLVICKECDLLNGLMFDLENRCCDLRCRNVPTGGDDYDVEWFVVEHYMQEPREREIGSGRNVMMALMAAFCR
jgi:hypothetical protein